MKVLLQRHGIVIKSVTISGDKASIGSGPDRDVIIDDPYLAPHVADFVRQADGWHIVDSATSLEGVTRAGARVDDELLAADQVYSVGGFELVVQFEGNESPQRPAAPKTPASDPYIPATMMDQYIPSTMMEAQTPAGSSASRGEPRVTPHTMMDTELPPSAARREVPKTMYEPMPVSQSRPASPALVRPVVVQADAPRARKPRLVLILGAAFGLGILLLLIVMLSGGDKKKPVAEEKTETPKATSATVTTAVQPVPAVASADELLATLRFDEALAAWETQLGKSPADASLQQRHSELALEIARIHSANGSDDATKYYQRVIKFGAPGSEAVLTAKRKIGN